MDGLTEDLRNEILTRVFATDFHRLGYNGEGVKRTARRIVLRGETCYQFEEVRGTQSFTENFPPDAMRAKVLALLDAPGAWEVHVITASGDAHLRRTRKGRFLVSRSKPLQRETPPTEKHDRAKNQPLEMFDSKPLLQAVGIAGPDGALRASMRGKLDQVNAFLRELAEVTRDIPRGAEFAFLDAGCGLAYLTFAAHGFLTQAQGLKTRALGVDRNPDVIARAKKMAAALGVSDSLEFVCADLADAQPAFKPDLVASLHACDTATDEALALAVEWGSKQVLAAPCCQHELHASLHHNGALRGVLRHGILRERLGDVLTDTFRAQILRILGYRVTIAEFVSAEATARNIMLRATASVKTGAADAVAEYLALREFWSVTPWLEQRLATRLAPFLEGAT